MKKAMKNSDSYWQHKARQFSDLYAGQPFTGIPSRIVARFLKDRTETLQRLLPKTSIRHVLDVGCGSGVHMKLLAPRVRTVAGIDSSLQMLIFARRTLTRSAKKNWRLIHADASAIPFPPHTFDCIIAMGLLDYVTSPLQVLRECRRVMTARGVLVASMPKKPSIFSLLRSPVGDSIKRGIFHLPPVDHAVTKKELLLLFQTVGFRVVTLTSVWSAMWMVKARL